MKKIVSTFLFLSIALTLFSKEYFIGDIIKFNIETSKEKKEVESAFKDFEVEKIDKSDKGYVVTARAFSVGKKNVEIDKNKFQMEIKSSIDSNDKNIKEYFGNEKNDKLNMENENIKSFPYTYIIFIIIFLIIVGIVILIIKLLKRTNNNPYSILIREIEQAKNGDYFKESIQSLKCYIEKRYLVKTIDKTTEETIIEIKKVLLIEEDILSIKNIMNIADKVKFMKSDYDKNIIDNHSKMIMDIAKKIEEQFNKKEKGDVK